MNAFTAKEARQEILKRNKIKKSILVAEKNLFKYGSNFADNQKKLIELRAELIEQYPKFLESFKFYTFAS